METTSSQNKKSNIKREFALREERLQQLMENCRQEVLRQIIGPFGLTPAMFDDRDGGNVTTQFNAEKGIFAKESEEFRRTDYDYATAKRKKMQESLKNGSMNSQEFVDQYTGAKEPTRRMNSNGNQVMNAELDHTIPVKKIHGQGGWMKDKEGRSKLSSVGDNLNYTTQRTNRSKKDKLPDEFFSEDNGFEKNRIDPIVNKAKEAVEKELPSTYDRLRYHGTDLLKEGAKEAGKNALRQALGIVLCEFVNGSFVEIKLILKERGGKENLIDRLITSLKRVMDRVINKLKNVLDAVIQGGVQGFVSNLLTFLINNLITTSKKIVAVIREGMQSLWKAIKLMANPPEGISGLEITREVAKIIAVMVTAGIGIMLEESVKGFIMSIPLLVPVADVLAGALTAIMTGIAGALIVYGIDRLFDWLNSTGTDFLNAQEAHADAQVLIVERLQRWLIIQYESSRLYEACAVEYRLIQDKLTAISFHMEIATIDAEQIIQARSSMIDEFSIQLDRKKRLEDAFNSI